MEREGEGERVCERERGRRERERAGGREGVREMGKLLAVGGCKNVYRNAKSLV